MTTHANHGYTEHRRAINRVSKTEPTDQLGHQAQKPGACTYNFIHGLGAMPIKVQQSRTEHNKDKYTYQ